MSNIHLSAQEHVEKEPAHRCLIIVVLLNSVYNERETRERNSGMGTQRCVLSLCPSRTHRTLSNPGRLCLQLPIGCAYWTLVRTPALLPASAAAHWPPRPDPLQGGVRCPDNPDGKPGSSPWVLPCVAAPQGRAATPRLLGRQGLRHPRALPDSRWPRRLASQA